MIHKLINKICVFVLLISFFCSCNKDDNETSNNHSTDASVAMVEYNVKYGGDSLQSFDIYLPANRTDSATKLLIMVHGGAWVAGDKNDFNQEISAIKQQLVNYAIANVNYRLAQIPATNLWPTQFSDIQTVFEYLKNKANYYHFNFNKTVVYGASAGSQLAMLKAYKDNTNNAIKAVVNIFGPNDMQDLYYFQPTNLQSLIAMFLNGTPTSNPSNYYTSSPINYITNSSPATISIHGTADALVPYQQSIKLDSILKTKQIISNVHLYKNEPHGNFSTSSYNDAFSKILSFIVTNNP